MPGIVGIIDLAKPVSDLRREFHEMVILLKYDTDDLMKVVENKDSFLGVVNIDDGKCAVKYYTTSDSSVEVLVDGEVFIDDEQKRIVGSEYNIPASQHWHFYIPYLYCLWGDNFVDYIRGWFNILIIDNVQRRYSIVNSRFGMRALYYARLNGYFVFSSELKSLLKFPLLKRRINEKAIAEYMLFNYSLGDATYLRDVKLLDPASSLVIERGQLSIKKYWDCDSLFHTELLSQQDSIDGAEEILRNSIKTFYQDIDKAYISVTGGFDGRTILSLARAKQYEVALYSFGTRESEDMTIPKQISKKMLLSYRPIYLDEEYGRNLFRHYAHKTIEASDGRSTIARSHYAYASDVLSKETKVILTGNCGSELIRMINLTGEVINCNTKMLFRNSQIENINKMLHNPAYSDYYFFGNLDDTREAVFSSIRRYTECDSSVYDLSRRFYKFIVKEVFRKYFGAEIGIENQYLYNRMPFLDYRFVEFIFKTPFCGAYKKFFSKDPFERLESQQFYSFIIARNNKFLANMATGRGYSPSDLLTTRGRFRAGFQYISRRIYGRTLDAYLLNQGLQSMMSAYQTCVRSNRFVNKDNVVRDFYNGRWQSNKLEFYKAISLSIWMNRLQGDL